MDPKVKEALEALANGNPSLFACLWNSYRQKSFAYHNGKNPPPDPFAPIYEEARCLLSGERAQSIKCNECVELIPPSKLPSLKLSQVYSVDGKRDPSEQKIYEAPKSKGFRVGKSGDIELSPKNGGAFIGGKLYTTEILEQALNMLKVS